MRTPQDVVVITRLALEAARAKLDELSRRLENAKPQQGAAQ